MHVLVIEDHEGLGKTIEAVVAAAGHTVVRASNGRKGVKLFTQDRFDLVITDILMPVQEGLETIRQLRTIKPDLKIIAVSGSGRSQGMDFLPAASAFGAVATLQKPFQPVDLLQLLRTHATTESDH